MNVHKVLYKKYFLDDKPVIDENVTSSHWKEYSTKIKVKNIEDEDSEQFDIRGYGFGENQKLNFLNQIFSNVAISVYNFMLKMPWLNQDIEKSKQLVTKMGLSYSLDGFRQTCTLNFLKRNLLSPPKRILIIGDGYGILAALLHATYPDVIIYLIDLGPMLFFQSFYLNKAFPKISQSISCSKEVFIESAFNFLPADKIESLPSYSFDLAINIASMQEMDMKVVSRYFCLMRENKTKAFYCCNRLEKQMPGGEVSSFMHYPWFPSDNILIDELCPWHTWFLGYGDSPNVKLFGLPLPLVHRYDGPHWHRFALLSS